MFAALQQIFPLLFFGVWFGVMVILYLRLRGYQKAYLRRFPPVSGVPLDMVTGGNPFGAPGKAINQAMKQRQTDPELEQLRRDLWRRSRLVALWIFGFPLLVFAALIILSLTHSVH